MSETYGDDDGESEARTDPSIALPPDERGDGLRIRQSTMPPPRIGGEAERSSTIPPRTPAIPPRDHALPSRAASVKPPALPARAPLASPSRPLPPPPLPPSRASSAARPPRLGASSIPPTMPKPSDPPASREGSFLDRQRIAQLESQLEQARAAMARQREELDELRARIELGNVRIAELALRVESDAARSESDARVEALEARIAELEARPVMATRDTDEDAGELVERVARLEERLRTVEEGSAEARIRMRLERAGHRIEELDRRLVTIEESQRTTGAIVETQSASDASREERLTKLESLFDELVEEVRAEREALDLDGVRARLDDVETLVLSAGTGEEALRKKLAEQERALVTLRESMAPPAGDDLTRIKGIGPKYARLLADLGVTSFAHIAAWTDEDIERVAAQLGIPASRIKKAGWIEAAAQLAG